MRMLHRSDGVLCQNTSTPQELSIDTKNTKIHQAVCPIFVWEVLAHFDFWARFLANREPQEETESTTALHSSRASRQYKFRNFSTPFFSGSHKTSQCFFRALNELRKFRKNFILTPVLWASCRYLQFAEIRQLSGSVNFQPDRPATEKVFELGRDFGYPTIVRCPERILRVGIGIGKPEPCFFIIF